MKIIIEADKIKGLFGTTVPALQDILNNEAIKQMTKGLSITGIYKDTMDANNLNNLIIQIALPGGDEG